jgi:hypothetical protein
VSFGVSGPGGIQVVPPSVDVESQSRQPIAPVVKVPVCRWSHSHGFGLWRSSKRGMPSPELEDEDSGRDARARAMTCWTYRIDTPESAAICAVVRPCSIAAAHVRSRFCVSAERILSTGSLVRLPGCLSRGILLIGQRILLLQTHKRRNDAKKRNPISG